MSTNPETNTTGSGDTSPQGGVDTVDEAERQPRTERERTDLYQPRRVGGGLLDPKMLWKSLPDAFRKLDPRGQRRNTVMFVVEGGAVLTNYAAIGHTLAF